MFHPHSYRQTRGTQSPLCIRKGLLSPLLIFLWLTYCKSDVKLMGYQKVMGGRVAEETVAERH